MTRKLPYQRYEQLKNLGADLIEDYALCYPLEPLAVADLLGVLVTIHPRGLPAVALLCGTTDGYTERVQSTYGPKFRIHISGLASGVRQRFTLMHELAHIWLDHLGSDSPVSPEVAEAEANFLASYLLAPDALVVRWVPELAISGIAEQFEISGEAARLVHGRVVRAINRNAHKSARDQRILSSATRRASVGADDSSLELGSSA